MNKPDVSEYANYYENYIKLSDDRSLKEQLVEQQKETIAEIEGLSEAQLDMSYATGKWTVRELLQHVIDTEIVFAFRAFAIARGETQAIPGFDQDEYAASASSAKLSKANILDIYNKTRGFTLSLLDYIKDADLERKGSASGNSLSARAAGFIILGHEKHHLNVLRQLYFIV